MNRMHVQITQFWFAHIWCSHCSTFQTPPEDLFHGFACVLSSGLPVFAFLSEYLWLC